MRCAPTGLACVPIGAGRGFLTEGSDQVAPVMAFLPQAWGFALRRAKGPGPSLPSGVVFRGPPSGQSSSRDAWSAGGHPGDRTCRMPRVKLPLLLSLALPDRGLV